MPQPSANDAVPVPAVPRQWRGSHEFAIALVTLATLTIFGLAEPRFLAIGNLLDILRQTAVIAMLSFVMTVVIITRGIDVSMGGTLAFSGVVLGLVFQGTGSWILSSLAALATGVALGLINGVLIGVLGVSAFLTTFAMLVAARAAALVASHASSILISDPVFIWLGQGDMFGLPSSVLILLLLLALWSFVLRYTRLGRYVFAVGNSPAAAAASLLPISRILVLVYVLSGLSAAFCAILTVGRLGSAQPLAGAGVEFAALTAAVIGGSRLSGGKGSILGTFLGALLLGCLSTGLSFLQISQQMTYVVTGTLIILSVVVTDHEFRSSLFAFGARLRPSPAVRTAGGRSGFGRRLAGAKFNEVTLENVSKTYAGVHALQGVGFRIRRGEVLALLGENGAGKSTLVKCLAGAVAPDTGAVVVDGERFDLAALMDGIDCSTVHQHFSLAPDLSLVDNLAAFSKGSIWAGGQRRRVRERIGALRSKFGLEVQAEVPIGRLPVGQRQLAEIVKGLFDDRWLIVLDEPTSALSVRERDSLFCVIEQLRAEGLAIIYISHKMEEIFTIAQRVVVLRDGHFVAELPVAEASEEQLIQLMVGRKVEAVFPYFSAKVTSPALVVEGISDGAVLREASLTVNAGEIVGVAGLMGSGRTELLRCIAGLSRRTRGQVEIGGRILKPGNPLASRALGLAFVPEDRLSEGVFADMSVLDNLTLCWLSGAGAVPNRAAMRREADKWMASLDIRPRRPALRLGSLSGGNQQKVVLGRYLAMNPSVLVLDEPTQGVDVGAKSEIHRLIGELKKSGAATLIVSSELPELLSVADRVYVMAQGRSFGPLPHGSSQERVMELALQSSAPASATREVAA